MPVVPADHGALRPARGEAAGGATRVDPAATPCEIFRMVWPHIEVKESVTPCGSPEGGALWLSKSKGNPSPCNPLQGTQFLDLEIQARGEAAGLDKGRLRPNHAKFSHGLAAYRGQGVRDSLRGHGAEPRGQASLRESRGRSPLGNFQGSVKMDSDNNFVCTC
jgi:hypothetical protein